MLPIGVAAACGSACFGEGAGEVLYRDVSCDDNDEVFSDCERDDAGGQGGTGKCTNHTNDAGVICGKQSISTLKLNFLRPT